MGDEFYPRFQGWVRWCRSIGRYHSKTGSIEGYYRSPQIWDIVEPKGESVDLLDAFLLNKVYSLLPERPRRIIKILHFRTHWKPQWQAQKLGCHYLNLNELNNYALIAFSHKLDDVENKVDTSRHGFPVRPLLGGLTV